MASVRETSIPAVKIIDVTKYVDPRGYFCETYNYRALARDGIDLQLVQDNESLSIPCFTVRGLHFQAPPYAQAKLVRVLTGRILDVALDIRTGSPTFGRHVAVELDPISGRQLLVPKGFAHGFCTLEADTRVLYKVSQYYSPEHERGVSWCDPALGIDWPITPARAVLSERDAKYPRLAELPPYFHYADYGANA